jgi:hypothetical protein
VTKFRHISSLFRVTWVTQNARTLGRSALTTCSLLECSKARFYHVKARHPEQSVTSVSMNASPHIAWSLLLTLMNPQRPIL